MHKTTSPTWSNRYFLIFILIFSALIVKASEEKLDDSAILFSSIDSNNVKEEYPSELAKISEEIEPPANLFSRSSALKITSNSDPNAIAKDITVHLDANGQATISKEDIDNGSNDPGGIFSMSVTPSAFNCSNIGNNTVTLSVTNNDGNTSTATSTVTVIDNTPPNVLTKNITIQLDNNGSATLMPIEVDNGSNDSCGIGSMSVSPNSFDCSKIGANPVTLTVTDNNGNTSNSTAIVTVEDNIVPTAIAKNITLALNINGQATITAGDIDNGSNDACGIDSMSVSPNSFNCSNIGPNTVTLFINDSNGKTSTTTAIVTVQDNTPPIVQTKNLTIQLDEAGNASITQNSVNNGSTDACGPLTYATDITTFNCSNVGNNLVTLTVTDDNGNSATGTAIITIEENIIPVIEPIADINVNTDPGLCSATMVIAIPSLSDNCSPTIPSGLRDDNKALSDPYPSGETIITWTARDANNNEALPVEQKVYVKDNEAPITPQLSDIIWGCSYTVDVPVATDNCDGNIVAVSNPNRSTTFTESGTITWTFTDAQGNESSIDQTITINPIELDIDVKNISCNGFATGEAEALVTGGISPITFDWGPLGNGSLKDGLSPGTYTVTATDANGCTDTQEFSISEPNSFIEITNVTINKGCFEKNNATISVSAQGGTGNLSYSWDNGKTGPSINTVNNTLPLNNLILTITDENGCSIEETITVNAPEELEITNVVTTQTNTLGSATGTATAIIAGGAPNFTFHWSNGQTGQTAHNLKAGNYSVIVTDANGCTEEETVTIVDPLKVTMVPISRCLNNAGGLRTSFFEVESVEGGTGPYQYTWNFGGETVEFSPTNKTDGPGQHVVNYINPGVYPVSLTVKDNRGKEYTQTYSHYVGECFEACGQTGNLNFTLETFFIGKEDGTPLRGSECASYTGARYIYLKVEHNANAYNPSIEFIYSISQAGTFISEERITGCIDIGEGKIPPLFRIGEVQNYECGNAINLESFYMDWTNAKNKKCGDVRQRMCVSTNENNEIHFPLSARIEKIDNFCFGYEKGVIEIIPTGGAGEYGFRVQNIHTNEIIGPQGSSIFENLPAGTYKAMVSDEDETFTVNNIIITQPNEELQLVEIGKNPLVCNGGNNATATVRASGGTAPYTIVWDHISQTSTDTTGTANNLSAGTYVVNVVDSNGCEVSTSVTITQPEQLFANAGVDQVLVCGQNQVQLGAVFNGYTNPRTGIEEFGQWRIINGPAGAIISQPNLPESLFTINSTGTYTLEWSIPCGSSDRVNLVFSNCSTIDFDGIDDHIDFGNYFNLQMGFTLEAWIKQDPNDTGLIKTILSKRDQANLGVGGYDLIIENNTPKFRWNNEVISSNYQIDSDRWYHIAVIQGGDESGIYIDGLRASEDSPGLPNSTDDRFLIGAMSDNTSQLFATNFFHGWIEEVRIWNTSLNLDQLKFMMNQRIKNNNSTGIMGEIIPLNVPNNLDWGNLTGYYRLITSEATNGITKNKIPNGIDGRLKNIQSTQQNTAPLPYIATGGNWWTKTSWLQPNVWDPPNSMGINGEKINWNIVRLNGKTINNPATSDNSNSIKLLGLLDNGGYLIMDGENNISGNEVLITHYLQLDGVVDLNGESQLIQTQGSIALGQGYLERDQQGTASSYNYNYWSSPVAPGWSRFEYKVNEVLFDGSIIGTGKFKNINFQWPHTHADGSKANPIKISDYWINTFRKKPANQYSAWEQIGSNTPIKIGEGYTMKGSEDVHISIGKLQNYTFKGFPNNGDIYLDGLSIGQNYLIGNPYPSAIDGDQFIRDNASGTSHNSKINFNGVLYFWDHFAGKTHILAEYVGGYAARVINVGVAAAATDHRINSTGESSTDYFNNQERIPQRYIPVGQGFFINTAIDPSLGNITSVNPESILFNNFQRKFALEGTTDSQFLRPEYPVKGKKQEDNQNEKSKIIRLNFRSSLGYNRQIAIATDLNTTLGYDIGYDAPLNDNFPEDMYWLINSREFVIQGVPNYNLNQEFPIGLHLKEKGAIKIEIGGLENVPDDLNLFIKDSLNQSYHNLRKSAFIIELEAGEILTRFSLVFNEITVPEIPDESEEEEEEEEEPNPGTISPEPILPGVDVLIGNPQVFYMDNNRELVVTNPEQHQITKITLHSLSGQIIEEYLNLGTQMEIILPVRSYSSSVYVVKMYTEKGIIFKKMIINN